MIAVVQRVNSASVLVKNKLIASIGKGAVILVCFQKNDNEKNLDKFIKNLDKIRIFSSGKEIDLTIKQVKAQILIVPEFTLAASFKSGRPNFSGTLKPKLAKPLFGLLCNKLKTTGFDIYQGQFGANMQLQLENNGPVTFIFNI